MATPARTPVYFYQTPVFGNLPLRHLESRFDMARQTDGVPGVRTLVGCHVSKHECILVIIHMLHPNKINIKDVLSTHMLFQTFRCYNVQHLFFICFSLLCCVSAMFLLPPCVHVVWDCRLFASRSPVAHPDSETAAVGHSAALRRCNFPSMTSSEETQQTPGGAVQILQIQQKSDYVEPLTLLASAVGLLRDCQ